MIKKMLFSFVLMMTVFTCMGFANFPQYRLKFTVSGPFLLEKKAQLALPAGEYWVNDIGTSSGHVLALEAGRDKKHVAFLFTAPIDRAVVSYRDKARAVFDLESDTQLPVIKEFYIPGTDGYEVLSAVYKEKSEFIDVATLSKTKTVTTEQTITNTTETAPAQPAPTPEVNTEPTPEATPAPVEQPAPAMEEPSQNEIQPTPSPAPIRERQRVRKD